MDMPQFDPESEAFLDGIVEDGRYASRDDILREGVRLVREREAKLARFDAEIMKGITSADHGDLVDVDEAFDALDRELQAIIDRDLDEQLAGLRAGMARGVADVEAGRVVDAATAFDELEEHYRRLSQTLPERRSS